MTAEKTSTETGSKTCTKCGKAKILSYFSVRVASRDGLTARCKQCVASDRVENKDRISATRKRWASSHKDAISESNKRYRKSHSKEIRDQQRLWRDGTKEERAEYAKAYCQTQAFRDNQASYRMANKRKTRAQNQVNKAIANGQVIRPTTCSKCKCECKPDAHHWSYKEEHWFDVAWLCRTCHRREHVRLKKEGVEL